ncbi:RIPP2 protein, partial [Podargus strigoides]|nr:RIPP2 protein [Podargus strigoides]
RAGGGGGRAAQQHPPAGYKSLRPLGGQGQAAVAGRRTMDGSGYGRSRSPSAALPPQGYPLLSSASARAVLPWARSPAPFWRPWVPTPGEAGRRSGTGPAAPHSPRGAAETSRKLAQYTHPVRLFWPKSRCYDYLYQEAEALLKNFPVQATISFYEDSDSEDDEDELEQDSRTESDC